MNSKSLFELAKQARENAYSPYSTKKVGAAIRFENGKVYTGCNIENSSYGATICAERTSITKGTTEGLRAIEEVMIVTDATPPWSPCGICRQTLSEFASPETPIHLRNLKNEGESTTLGELLPNAFTPARLHSS